MTTTTTPRTLLIMAAGTGGHIIPGIAIAKAMQARGWTIRWLGTAHGMENQLVPQAGLSIDTIAFAGLRGKGLQHTLKGMAQLLTGFMRCMRLMRSIRPDVVLGMGGYVTIPGGLSARLCGRPLVLVNSDAALLMSNKVLMPFAERILFGFPGQTEQLGKKALWTGNSIRAEIAALPEPQQRFATRQGPLRILVVGGSLGATILNRVVPAAVQLLGAEKRPIITHQSGAQHIEALRTAYQNANVEAEVLAFIDDMPSRYADVDLVICRAGAITASELTAGGVASVLVPLTVSTTSHQRDNALYLEQAGAALHIPQADFTPHRLAQLLESLARQRLLEMAQAARQIGKPHATETVASILEEIASAALNTSNTVSATAATTTATEQSQHPKQHREES